MLHIFADGNATAKHQLHLALFGQSQKSSNFFLGGLRPPDPPFKSAAVAASASQVRTLEPSRPLSRPPGGGVLGQWSGM